MNNMILFPLTYLIHCKLSVFFVVFLINTLIDRADCWASFVAEDAYSPAVTAPVPKFKNGKS